MFIPVHGVKGIKPVVSILHGHNAKLPVVLVDSDKAGKGFQDRMKKGLYVKENEKVLEMDTYTDKEGSEIEDLMLPSLITKNFNSIFRPDEDIKVDDKKPIVPQLKEFLKEHKIEEIEGWKVEISKKAKQQFRDKGTVPQDKGTVPEDMKANWKKLFNNLQDNSK